VREPVLGLLGSGEFEPWSGEVDRWLVDRSRTGGDRVLVLPTASAPEGDDVFGRWASMGLAHYADLGIAAEVVQIRTREDAQDPAHADRLATASAVFFSGGNPAYLSATLAGTAFWTALLAAMDEGLAYGGCSAGVACLGEQAIDTAAGRFEPDVWRPGLRVFPGVWFGPHWDALDLYVPGLKDFIEASVPRDQLLLAIDEHTAVVGNGRAWEVMGTASAHVRTGGAWTHHPAGSRFTLTLPTE
jgi:cyanophycinase